MRSWLDHFNLPSADIFDIDPRFLAPLKQLEALSLLCDVTLQHRTRKPDLNQLDLPNLRELRLSLERGDPWSISIMLLAKLAASSTAGIRVLDLDGTKYRLMSRRLIRPFLPLFIHVVHFTWDFWFAQEPIEKSARNGVVALLGAMTSLRSIHIATWTLEEWAFDALDPIDMPIDRKLLDTLATLSSLHDVTLIVYAGVLDKDHIISFIDSHTPLRYLSIRILQGGWTSEERENVRKAAKEARVAFSYSVGPLE